MLNLQHFDLHQFIISIVVLVCSISLHEFGHAISADYLGDPGPRRDGRITLWPDKHFDPVGFTMLIVTSIVGYGIAWGKPVMVNTRYFKHPARDLMIVSAFGPLMNLLLALIFGAVLRIMIQNGSIQEGTLLFQFLEATVWINLSLLFLNLIPLPPLDGSKILSGLLPLSSANQYERFAGQYGMILLLVLFISGGITFIIKQPVLQSINMIVGPYWH